MPCGRQLAFQMMTRTGVGLKPLQGLLICGQLESTHKTSISAAYKSTWSPALETPSTTVKSPAGSIGTLMKKLTLATMSRFDRPCLASSSRKFSRHACWYFVGSPNRTALLSQEQHPAEVS